MAAKGEMGGTDLGHACKWVISGARGLHRGLHRPYTFEQLRSIDLAVIDEDVCVRVGSDEL